MTKEQNLAKEMILSCFIDNRKSITRTIIYMRTHDRYLYINWSRSYRAWKSLKETERNEVIYEILREEL